MPAELGDAGFYDRVIEIQIDDTGYDVATRRFCSPLHRTGAIYKVTPAQVLAEKTASVDGVPGLFGSVRLEAHGAGPVGVQILCFRSELAVGTGEEERVGDERVQRDDVGRELRGAQRV
jgi:hypothetical protein